MPKDADLFLHDIFVQHSGELAAFIRGKWPGEQDVADIVHDAFLRLSQVSDPDAIRNPRAFLYQTVANLTIDRHRRRETRDRFVDEDADDQAERVEGGQPTPERQLELHEALDRFSEALDQLPELTRHAFVLYRIEGMSHAEIAVRLGISVRSSERHVMKALKFLSAQLGSVYP